MDKERIVGASKRWEEIKYIFRQMDLTVSQKNEVQEYVSHGVLLIHENEGLFLQMDRTYEYQSIVKGQYTGAKLYHYLSLITMEERQCLLEHPFVQWRRIFPHRNMPGGLLRKLRLLQRYLPALYRLIPSQHEGIYGNYLLTIPKGRAYEGESSMDAALRELEEETGIILGKQDLTTLYIDRHTGTDGNIYVTYIYGAYVNERPNVNLSSEFSGYTWLSLSEQMLMSRQMRMLYNFLYNMEQTRKCNVNNESQKQSDRLVLNVT